jgi:hypothetical protein
LLAAEFTETYKGEPCFLGRIHTMRLAYNRMILTVSLDWLFNHVACQYTSALDNSTLMTSFYSDAASQGRYGIRSHIIRPSDFIGLSEAEDLAQQFLSDFSGPRVSRGPLAQKISQGTLKVQIQGMSQTLDAQFYDDPSDGQADASAEVALTLAGASLVEAGDIVTNTTQVSVQSDYRRRLQRLAAIAARRDGAGNPYNYGAVASRSFDYGPAVPPTAGAGFRYDLFIKRPYIQHFSGSNYVPAPLVRPGGWSRIMDMRPAPYAESATNDPLNQYDAQVVYDKNGATLQGGSWGERERSEAIQMSLIARRV